MYVKVLKAFHLRDVSPCLAPYVNVMLSVVWEVGSGESHPIPQVDIKKDLNVNGEVEA